MTVMIEFFAEERSGLKICKQVFRDTESGKFKVMILPRDEKLWFGISIRVGRDRKIDLECLEYTFHFVRNDKGEYCYKNGKGPVPLGKTVTEHLQALTENFWETESNFKKRPHNQEMAKRK
jgi:hypothetical protein